MIASLKNIFSFICNIKIIVLYLYHKYKIMKQLEADEWLYKGCFIQKNNHPQLVGNYEIFQNNEAQTHIGRCYTFREAKALCKHNECFDNFLKY